VYSNQDVHCVLRIQKTVDEIYVALGLFMLMGIIQ